MKRSIVRHGLKTLTVSLPAKWCQRYNIKAGDEVDIEEDGALLALTLDRILRARREASIDVTPYDERLIVSLLNNLYREGFNKLTITYDDPQQLRCIQDHCMQSLPGFEVISEKKGKCRIDTILTPDQTQFETLYRRIFLVTHEMFQNVLDSFLQKRFNDISLLEVQYNKVEQYTNFCLRNLYNENVKKIFKEFYVILIALLIASTLRRIGRYCHKKKVDCAHKDIISFLERTRERYHEFFEMYYRKDALGFTTLDKQLDLMLSEDLPSLAKQKNEQEIVIIMYISQIIRFLLVLLSPATLQVLEIEKKL